MRNEIIRALGWAMLLLLALALVPFSLLDAQEAFVLPEGKVGVAYEFRIQTEGGLPPLQWKVVQGELPPGIELLPLGTLRGIPTSPRGEPFRFSVEVSDSSQPPQTFPQAFALLVRPAPLRIVLGPAKLKIVAPTQSGTGTPTGPPAGQTKLSDPQGAPGEGKPRSPAGISITPASATAGDPAFSLNVAGTNFVPGATVQWNGSNRPTTFQDSSNLIASIPAADVAVAGQAMVTVVNPGSSGGVALFDIKNPVPSVASLSPPQVPVGTADFTLTVNGAKFVPGSVVLWNGIERRTTFVNNNQVTAAVSAADITTTGSADVELANPAPGGGRSANKLSVKIDYPTPIAGGTITHRAIVGTDVSGASSLPTQQKVFIEFNLNAPVPYRRTALPKLCQSGKKLSRPNGYGVCPGGELVNNPNYPQDQDPLSSRLNAWVNTRISSLPQQGTNPLSSANVKSSSDFINSLATSQLNKVVQGFEFLGGFEFRLAGPRRSFPFPFPFGHSKNSVSFVVAAGAITPFSVPDKTQQEFVATQDAFNKLFENPATKMPLPTCMMGQTTNCTPAACTSTVTTNCFRDIVFLSPDRDRFFRQYYAGLRLKTYYFIDPNESPERRQKCGASSTQFPNDFCKNFPGVFDILWGQNESITGGRLHGSVLRFEGFYPIPSIPGIYVYGTTLIKLSRRANIKPPLLLDLETSPLPVSNPAVFPATLDTTDRDFFRFGVGVDLIHFISSLSQGKGTQTAGQSTATGQSAPSPAGTPQKP